jgi:hypothetical protein
MFPQIFVSELMNRNIKFQLITGKKEKRKESDSTVDHLVA